MAKIILRIGKVVIRIIIPLIIVGLILFSMKILRPAKAVEEEPVGEQLSENLEQAELFDEMGQYTQDEQVYLDIITQHPGTDDALAAQTQLTLLYINSGRSSDAEAALEQLISSFSEHPDLTLSLLNISETYLELDKHNEVISLCEYILNNQPESEELIQAQTHLVQSYIALKDDQAAETAYEQLLSRFSNNEHIAAAVIEIASTYYWHVDQPEKTIQLYEYAMETWPDYVWEDRTEEIDHKITLGDSYEAAGDDRKALETYQDIFTMQPDTSQEAEAMHGYVGLKIALGEDPDLQFILDRFSTAFLYEENAPGELYDIGTAYEASGQRDEAVAVFGAILDNWSQMRDRIQVREALILADIAVGNEPNITEELNDLIAEFADNEELPGAILHIGGAYTRQGRYRSRNGDIEGEKAFQQVAISVWERLIEEELGDSEADAGALLQSGILYAQEFGEYQRGIVYCQAAVDIVPDYELGWVAYDLIARYTKKLRDSGAIAEPEANARIKDAYQAVVENWPDSRWVQTALLKLGRMSFAEGQLVDAIMYFEILLERSPKKVHLVGNDLIVAYEQMGDLAMAEQIRTELTKRNCPAK